MTGRHRPAVPAAAPRHAGGPALAARAGLREAHPEEPERPARVLPVRRRRAFSRRRCRPPPAEEPGRVTRLPHQVRTSSHFRLVCFLCSFLCLLLARVVWRS